MKQILVVSDNDMVRQVVRGCLIDPNLEVKELSSGKEVVNNLNAVDLIVLDFQIGNMGGMAVCMELHLEESLGNIPNIPVLMLLDRRADVFLARRCHVKGWILKPLSSFRLQEAVKLLLNGDTYYDNSYCPETVLLKS
ncbi:MAG: response regulator [Actinobacteria bacterium]|nr:response regulator [Actinomycetota bacterium]MCL6104302.1 response regulator [Actinomycetota bacterium]